MKFTTIIQRMIIRLFMFKLQKNKLHFISFKVWSEQLNVLKFERIIPDSRFLCFLFGWLVLEGWCVQDRGESQDPSSLSHSD